MLLQLARRARVLPARTLCAAAAKKASSKAAKPVVSAAEFPAEDAADHDPASSASAKKPKAAAAASKASSQKDALKTTLAMIEKQYGKGIVSQLGDAASKIHRVESISTGILTLDDALGCGGFPVGRIIEIFGPEASGKTSVALAAIAEAQKLGHECTFVDVEHALDVDYARGMGVDVDRLYLTQPDCGEDALDIVDHLVRSGAMKIIVVDSVSALLPKLELESEIGSEKIALQARLMSRSLRKLGPNVSNTGTILIFINQIRNKVGVMFGSPETTSGGHALRFYASCRLDTRKTALVKNAQGDAVGTTHAIKIVKNKVGAPFKKCSFTMRFGQGISRAGEVLDLGLTTGLVFTKGSFYYVKDGDDAGATPVALGQGREKASDALAKDEALMARCVAKLRTHKLSHVEMPTAGEMGLEHTTVVDDGEEEEGEKGEPPLTTTTT